MIKTILVCDRCTAEHELDGELGRNSGIVIDGKSVDLCDACYSEHKALMTRLHAEQETLSSRQAEEWEKAIRLWWKEGADVTES